MKFICKNCRGSDPCILDIGNHFDITGENLTCIYRNLKDAKWERFKEVTDCNQLPKLTADVFYRPDCPEWAQFAAVDGCGWGFYYEAFPKMYKHDRFFLLSTVYGKTQRIPGKFDGENWINSIVARLKKPSLPDWCKVGEWVYTCGGDYRKVEAISDGIVSLSGGLNIHVGDIHSELVKSRLRPYDAGEVPDLPFEVTEKNSNFRTTVVSCKGDKVWLACESTAISTEELKLGFTSKGKPCGVLEHLIKGEWVK